MSASGLPLAAAVDTHLASILIANMLAAFLDGDEPASRLHLPRGHRVERAGA